MKNGKYSLVEPGSGVTVFSMEGGEINLFGSYTNIITTGVDTYPPINDSLTSKKTENKTEQMEKEGTGVTVVLAVLGGLAIIAAPFISIPVLGLGSLLLGTVCVSASVETGRYTAETVKNDRITGYDRDIKDFRKGLADSASVGAKKGAEAFVTALDILSIVSGFNGIMGPKPPTAALAGADGEMIAVPEILEVDAGISVLYSKSFPEGPFGEKKEVEEKEGVYVESGSNKIEIKNPVLENIRTGSALKEDALHAFNDIIDNYAGYATKFSLVGRDGIKRSLYQIKGSLNGKQGIFEWIVDPDPTKGVTHRRFIEGIDITGKPNARP